MLDIQFIRNHVDSLKQTVVNKGLNPAIVEEVISLDSKRKNLIAQSQVLRTKRNQLNDQLKQVRNQELIDQSISLKQTLVTVELELKQVETNLSHILLQLPNITLEEVPIGKNSQNNQLVREVGVKPNFNFPVKNHLQLGINLNLIDTNRGSKVAGFRGYYLKNQAVMLQFGLMRYALDKLVTKGFTPIITPVINHKEAFINTGHFPWGESEAYKIVSDKEGDTQYYLAGTAEVPLVSYHAGEILNEKDLPIKYAGISPCYRREIGNYGKDTKGIYRVHEFMKVEQVILCTNNITESRKWHETLLNNAEEMLAELKLPYRVLLMCTGDMGEPQMKKYDIETWMPGRNSYGETMSNSIMGDFQSRRANIRYRAKDGTVKFVHMLNNTAVASSRMIIAILENYQQADGSINISPILIPYVGFENIQKPSL